MATKVDFHLDFNTALAEIVNNAAANTLLPEIAQHAVNEARQMGPYATGHNAASIFWAKGNGVPKGRDPIPLEAKKKGLTRASSASDVAEKDAVVIGTSSGYGGLLELNPHGATFTHKGTPDAGGVLRGSHFIRRGLARVLADTGGMKTKAAATAILIEAEAKMTKLQRIL